MLTFAPSYRPIASTSAPSRYRRPLRERKPQQLDAANHASFAVDPQTLAPRIDEFLQQFGHVGSSSGIGSFVRNCPTSNEKSPPESQLAFGWARLDTRRGGLCTIPFKLLAISC